MTTAAASTKRSQIWKEIRQLRAAKKTADHVISALGG